MTRKQTIKALELYWYDQHDLLIDEISIVTHLMFAKLSNTIDPARAGKLSSSEEPFHGLNVMLVSDSICHFHM